MTSTGDVLDLHPSPEELVRGVENIAVGDGLAFMEMETGDAVAITAADECLLNDDWEIDQPVKSVDNCGEPKKDNTPKVTPEETVTVQTCSWIRTFRGDIQRVVDTRAFGTLYHAALADLLKIHAKYARHSDEGRRTSWSAIKSENRQAFLRNQSLEAMDKLIAALFMDRNVRLKGPTVERILKDLDVDDSKLIPCACAELHAAIERCPNASAHAEMCGSVLLRHDWALPFSIPTKTFNDAFKQRKTRREQATLDRRAPPVTRTLDYSQESPQQSHYRGRVGKRSRSRSRTYSSVSAGSWHSVASSKPKFDVSMPPPAIPTKAARLANNKTVAQTAVTAETRTAFLPNGDINYKTMYDPGTVPDGYVADQVIENGVWVLHLRRK
jgi:hypothetical protein